MRVMAVDPGSANIGVSIFDNDKLVYCTRLNYTSSYEKFVDKLNDILSKVYHEFLRLAHKYEVQAICWEIVPAIGNMNHKDFVVSVSAALKILAFHYELQWQGVPANTVKKLFTGNGRASKDEMRDTVLQIFPDFKEKFPEIGFRAYDAYDSVAIGTVARTRGSWHTPTSSNLTGSEI